MKVLRAAAATAAFLVLLVVVYWLHSRWLPVNVVLYGALLDVAIAAVLAALLLALPWFRIFNGFERAQLLAIWLLAGYALAISVPTVIDRSLSFYILEKIQSRGGAVREDRFAGIFTEEYLHDHQLVAVRLTEQEQSGTVTIEAGCVRLTPRGQRLAAFSSWFRRQWLPRRRLLLGEYTDRLTRPFPERPQAADDACR